MRIGIDFDNTLADYDEAFNSVAIEWGLLPEGFTGGKRQVRDAVRRLTDGETQWMKLQGRMYGAYMPRAVPMPGVMDFLARAKQAGATLIVVSHKTEAGHFDIESINLHDAARAWMAANGIFDLIDPSRIFFETTRDAKIARIASLGLDAFIDDLEEVFREPHFPKRVQACLYAAGSSGPLPHGPFQPFRSFDDIGDELLGQPPLIEAVTRLAGRPIASLRRVRGGGNNRLYRVESADGPMALKTYPPTTEDSRDRLGTEFAALRFLGRHGIEDVPAAIAADPIGALALYSWADGVVPTDPGPPEIDAALSFVERLHALRQAEGAQDLPLATEACLSGAELVDQITRRLGHLSQVAASEPALPAFLTEVKEALAGATAAAQAGYAECGHDFAAELALHHRTLSPSDFGFHNALRREDGRLIFLDMEYFGWDDPVKLAADFILHPGMALSCPLRDRFGAGTMTIFAGDAFFGRRLALLLPLYCLRWCMIVLNEFLPERWARRVFAGADDRQRVQHQQLAKARALLSAARVL